MFKYNLYMASFAIALLFSMTSCDPDDPDHIHEEELITTITYTLTPQGAGNVVQLKFQDLDGDGGNAPVYMTETLAANTVYSGSITLSNESETPSEDITEEVEEEAAEHQFFFQTDISDLSVTYLDVDADGNPVGLETTLTTGDATNGQLTIILRHEPDKDGENVSQGDITNAGGETDINVTFDVTIQ